MHPHPSPLWLRRRAHYAACTICAQSVHSTRWLRFKLRHYLSGMHKCPSPRTPMWSTNLRRIDPINLSGKAGLPRRARRDGLVTDAYNPRRIQSVLCGAAGAVETSRARTAERVIDAEAGGAAFDRLVRDPPSRPANKEQPSKLVWEAPGKHHYYCASGRG